MNLRQLFDTAVRLGIAQDPRGEAAVREQLARRRREYDALPAWQQPYYDQERFTNPFGDVRIAYSPRPAEEIELDTILLGIDIRVPELLLADRLRAEGSRIDAVIAHHTSGIGIAPSLAWDFMPVLVDMLVGEGVPRAAAEACIYPYIEDKIRTLEDFHRVGPDTARLLDLPLGCIHTPADYYITAGVRAALGAAGLSCVAGPGRPGARDAGPANGKPETVGDIVRALCTIPEVRSSAALGAGVRVMTGDETRPAGRVFCKFGGGYILPPAAYPLLGQAGVNTVLQIGCGPEHARAAEEAGITIVRIAHAACDNIGINLLLDDVIRAHGPLNVIPCGAFERITRLA
jgi:hypothetical protein